MQIRILDKGKIKFNGVILEEFEVYDVDDEVAEAWVKSGDAARVDGKIAKPAPEPQDPVTPPFDKEANGGYVGEAKIDETKKKKLKEEGKLNDETPVVGKDTTVADDSTPEPVEKTVVLGEDGQPLTEEQVKEREAQAAAKAQDASNPTVAEVAKAPEVPTE